MLRLAPINAGQGEDLSYFLFKLRQIVHDDIPNSFQFHAFIVMDQNIPQAAILFQGTAGYLSRERFETLLAASPITSKLRMTTSWISRERKNSSRPAWIKDSIRSNRSMVWMK
jgi:hypothetical protein